MGFIEGLTDGASVGVNDGDSEGAIVGFIEGVVTFFNRSLIPPNVCLWG